MLPSRWFHRPSPWPPARWKQPCVRSKFGTLVRLKCRRALCAPACSLRHHLRQPFFSNTWMRVRNRLRRWAVFVGICGDNCSNMIRDRYVWSIKYEHIDTTRMNYYWSWYLFDMCGIWSEPFRPHFLWELSSGCVFLVEQKASLLPPFNEIL